MIEVRPTETLIAKNEATARRGMVATKDKLATLAGVQMLEAGGNAVDAAVAACLAVGVVEPASSGIGGGGYLVYQVDGKGGVIGFPMRGPLAGRPDMFELSGERAAGNFFWPGVVNDENLEGYRSIATPGAVAGLCRAHERLGRLPLKDVVEPALSLARDGYAPGWFNLYSNGLMAGKLFRYAELRRIFMPDGELPSGDLTHPPNLRQPELAQVLEAVGREGPDAFYKGDVAIAIASDIQDNGGILSTEDLARYRPLEWEDGLELSYRGHTVRVPPYTCAGPTSAMTLKLLDGFDVAAMGHNSAEMLHTYVSCARLAYADRFQYMADQEFVEVPWNGMLSDAYTRRRRGSIGRILPEKFEPGDPWIEEGRRPTRVLGPSAPDMDHGTTHLCVMDGDGNAVSLTNTLGAGFGSGVVPKGTGIVMNNGMIWWDPVPGHVNSIAPGKLGLNNMTPALVLGKDGVRMSVGASGGRRITNCVTQLIVKALDYGMAPQEAIDSPRVDCSTPHTSVAPGMDGSVTKELEARGHVLLVIGEGFVQTGFASFASPVVITRDGAEEFRAGVDTFHSAYAQGL
ncbi:MAG: gamma-glutamyltransferase [SAR202 cluster bacterium]|nr:gamma-glutamyltransferase [SAR202 cluster bacterium]